MKKIINKILSIKNVFTASLTSMFVYLMTSPAFAANGFTKAASDASKGVQDTGKDMVKPLIIIVGVIIGIIFIIGSQRQKDEAKERIPMILIGVAMILGAVFLADTVFGWFS